MYVANKIIDGLYQGGMPPPGPGLIDSGVDVLVLAAAENQDPSYYPGVTIITAPGDDDERPSRFAMFINVWTDAAQQVADHVKAGRTVLVTCIAGQNRSGFIVALAVRYLTGWTGEKIIKHIQRHRHHALNNKTFVRYIKDSFPTPRE